MIDAELLLAAIYKKVEQIQEAQRAAMPPFSAFHNACTERIAILKWVLVVVHSLKRGERSVEEWVGRERSEDV